MQLTIVTIGLVAFLWLIANALRGAWNREQEWKAQEAAWTAAHPETQPADTQAIRWVPMLGVLGTLAAVAVLIGVGLNVPQACLIVAVPVLIARYLRQRGRERDATSRAQFGDYTPTFRERR